MNENKATVRWPISALTISLSLFANAAALAQADKTNQSESKASPTAVDIDRVPEESWLTLTGKIESQSADGFVLDNKAGDITVEVGESDWYDNTRSNLVGKNVRVSGIVDKDLFDRRTIKAEAIRVDGNYHYKMKAEKDRGYYILPLAVATEEGIFVNMRGDIQKVEKSRFDLKTKAGTVGVDLSRMGFEQAVKSGQRVAVYGRLEHVDSGMKSARIRAISVTPLLDDFGRAGLSAK